MKLYNTLSRKIEEVGPAREIKLYTCGPTVYDYAHIGNLRNVIFNDTLKRALLAAGYDDVRRRHARFVAWRTQWSHLVACHACKAADPQDFPSVLWSPCWTLRRLDAVHCSGWAGSEAARRMQTQEVLAEWLRRSTPAFPASVLGL